MDLDFTEAAKSFAGDEAGINALIDKCRETGESLTIFLYREGYYLTSPNEYDCPPHDGVALIVHLDVQRIGFSTEKIIKGFWESFNQIID